MPPHGNLTNMGLTEPENKVKNWKCEKRNSQRLPGEKVTFFDLWAQMSA